MHTSVYISYVWLVSCFEKAWSIVKWHGAQENVFRIPIDYLLQKSHIFIAASEKTDDGPLRFYF